MVTLKRFEDIEAWQKARALSKVLYAVTNRGEFARDFGLRDQIRRAGVSVMSNIAEGFERDGSGELKQFLSMAKGSNGELRSQLYVAYDAGYLSEDEFLTLKASSEEISKMLSGFMKYLNSSDIRGRKHTQQ